MERTHSPSVWLVLFVLFPACATTYMRGVPDESDYNSRSRYFAQLEADPANHVNELDSLSNSEAVIVRGPLPVAEGRTSFDLSEFYFHDAYEKLTLSGAILTTSRPEKGGLDGRVPGALVGRCAPSLKGARRLPRFRKEDPESTEAEPRMLVFDMGVQGRWTVSGIAPSRQGPFHRLLVSARKSGRFEDVGCESWDDVEKRIAAADPVRAPEALIALRSELDYALAAGEVPELDAALRRLDTLVAQTNVEAPWEEADRVNDPALDAAWALGDLRKVMPLWQERAKLTKQHGRPSKRDVVRYQKLLELLGREIDRATADGRLATAAAYGVMVRRLTGVPSDKQSSVYDVMERRGGEATSVLHRGELAGAKLLMELMVPMRAQDLAREAIRQLYERGEFTSHLNVTRFLRLIPGDAGGMVKYAGSEATLTVVEPFQGGLSEGSKVDVTAAKAGQPNPDYADWLSRLEQYDREIAQLGGQVESSVAASKRAQYLQTSVAVEGSSVRTNTSETAASLQARQNAAIGAIAGRMELGIVEGAREKHLSREPPIKITTREKSESVQTYSGKLTRTLLLLGNGLSYRFTQDVDAAKVLAAIPADQRNFMGKETMMARVKDAADAELKRDLSYELGVIMNQRIAARAAKFAVSKLSAEERDAEIVWMHQLYSMETVAGLAVFPVEFRSINSFP